MTTTSAPLSTAPAWVPANSPGIACIRFAARDDPGSQ